jgi:hypothetical protein
MSGTTQPRKGRILSKQELPRRDAERASGVMNEVTGNSGDEAGCGDANVDGEDTATFRKFVEGKEENNPRGGLLISPGDEFTIHPAARRIPRSAEQRKTLEEDLRRNGQLNDVIYRVLPDGTKEVLDGAGRIELQHAQGQAVSARELTEHDLRGRSIEQFIYDVNTAVGGRKLSEIQQAIVLYLCCLHVTGKTLDELKAEAGDRQKGGKRVEGEKGGPATILAKHANVKEARVRKVLELAIAEAPEELWLAVWNGFPISVAVQIAKTEDAKLRATLVTLAKSGKKDDIKKLLRPTTPKYDKNGNSIPNGVIKDFEKAAPIKKAVDQLKTIADLFRQLEVEQKYIETLERMSDDVDLDVFYVMCEWCEATGTIEGVTCHACHGKRYMTRREFNTASHEEEGKLLKAR